jgi:hypothetical protein
MQSSEETTGIFPAGVFISPAVQKDLKLVISLAGPPHEHSSELTSFPGAACGVERGAEQPQEGVSSFSSQPQLWFFFFIVLSFLSHFLLLTFEF